MIFLFASVAVFNLAAIFMPKRVTWGELYSTAIFTICLQQFVDITVDLKYDLYGYFSKGADLKTLIIVLGVYPAVNSLVINFYPYSSGIILKALYIVVLSAFALAYEYVLIQVGVFYHNGWNLWFSALVYPFLIIILMSQLKLSRALHGKGQDR